MIGPSAHPPARRALLTPRSSAILAQKAGRAIEFILAHGTLPVLYWLKKDVLGVPADRELRNLEKLADRIRILESQSPDGGWRLKRSSALIAGSSSGRVSATVRNGFRLIDYGCAPGDEALRKAASFVLSRQNRNRLFGESADRALPLEGQALCLTLLSRLGLEKESRVRRAYRCVVEAQGADGGWRPSQGKAAGTGRRGRPSSPRTTGLILGALAESERWRTSREGRRAGEWILGWFFQERGPDGPEGGCRWSDIAYPFWSTNILGCVDALSRMGFRPEERRVRLSIEWLLRRQQASGHWESRQDKAGLDEHLWVTLAVLRVLKRFGLISP